MHSDYYRQYFELERSHWYFLARNHIIMTYVGQQALSRTSDLRILNIGVATGHTSELLGKYGQVSSVEYDQACFEFTRAALPDLKLIQGSILDLPFEDHSFDLVCAFDVIEHVKDDEKAVEEMRRVCRPGGQMIITVPAFMSLWSHHDEVNMHERRYAMRSLTKLFEGQHIQYRTYFNFWLFLPIAGFRIFGRWWQALLGRKKSLDEMVGADFRATGHNGLVQNLLYWVFKSEASFVKRRIRLPFGVSLLVGVEKR